MVGIAFGDGSRNSFPNESANLVIDRACIGKMKLEWDIKLLL